MEEPLKFANNSPLDASHQHTSSSKRRNSSATSDRDKDRDRDRDMESTGEDKDAERRVLDRQLVLSRNQIQVLTDKIESLNEVAAKK